MSDFTGSAVVVLELAREFVARGHTVEIGCVVLSEPMSALLVAESIAAFRLDRLISLRAYDLVWCQHLTFGWIELEEFVGGRVPAAVVFAHLGPFEYLELPTYPLEREVASVIACNSEETKRAILAALGGTRREVVFHNAAPGAFHAAARERSELRRILCISNHAVAELTGALDCLRAEPKLEVASIGVHTPVYRLVQPGDIAWADVVVTIGKSAVSALVGRAPVFVYGPHGGDGYVVEESFGYNVQCNFSGRPYKRRRSADALAREIIDGFDAGVHFASSLDTGRLSQFDLSVFVTSLLSRLKSWSEPVQITKSMLPMHQAYRNVCHIYAREQYR